MVTDDAPTMPRRRLELTPHSEKVDRSDLAVPSLDVVDRIGAPPGINRAIPHAVGRQQVADASAHRHAGDILVLEIEIEPDRAFPLSSDFGESIVQSVVRVFDATAPCPARPWN